MSVMQQLKEWLAQVSYRPGWSLALRCTDGGVELFIAASVINAEDPDHCTTIQSRILIPHRYAEEMAAIGSPERFLAWVGDCLMRMEAHEHLEFFRYQGRCVKDPHPLSPM